MGSVYVRAINRETQTGVSLDENDEELDLKE
jgi:hypothetical protein